MTAAAGINPGRWRLTAAAVAWLLGALTLVLLAVYAILAAATRDMTVAGFWSTALTILPLAAVGAVVGSRQPRNPIGWICLSQAALFALGSVGGDYAVLAYQMGKHLPFGPVAVLLALYWSPLIVAFPVAILLFPDGTLPSRRWRWVMWAYLAVGACWPVSTYAVAIAAIAGHDIHVLPGGDLRVVDFPSGNSAWLSTVDTLVLPVLAAFWALFVLRQVLSWRRADGERRQQLKWLMSGTAVCMFCTVLVVVPSTIDPSGASPALQAVVAFVSLGITALPVGMGVAILKYRLYDIDRIISRTLAYAIVTGLLVGVYAGLVLLATQALPFALSTPVAVAGATLVAAGLFNPLRRRVQKIVDRRFNRARYDADRVIAEFAARLTGAIDIDSVRTDLLDAVGRALEPARAWVWQNDGDLS